MNHQSTLTVRSYELDTYGHVNNANYLNYLEYARMWYLEDTGFPYEEFRSLGYGLYVSRIDIRYLKPAFLHDELTIVTSTLSMGRVKGSLSQRINRGEEPLVDARVDFAMVNAEGRPSPMPADLRSRWPVAAALDALRRTTAEG